MTTVDLAPPVLGTLSPSRAGDFMTCPLLYRFRMIDRLPQRPSLEAARGSVVHAVLERLFGLPREQRTLPAATAMIEPEWRRLVEIDPELADLFPGVIDTPADAAPGDSGDPPIQAQLDVLLDPAAPSPDKHGEGRQRFDSWLAGAAELLEQYFVLEEPSRLEPAERELLVETVLDSGLALRGYVDRLDVTADGQMRVVDYKTGRAPSELFEMRALFQMRFYALVLWRLHGRVPRVLQLLYLGSGEVLRYEPDEADLRATERKLVALWTAIERATREGDWRPSPSRLCDWCDHHALCPAFGGTPPPLPSADRSAPEDAAGFEAPSPRSPTDAI